MTIVLFSIIGGTAAANVTKARTIHLWFIDIVISGVIRCQGTTMLPYTTTGNGATTTKKMSTTALPGACPVIVVRFTI